MERQDTQPLFPDDDFSQFLQQHPSLVSDLMQGPQELSYSLFEDGQQSSDKCNNSDDKQLQQQQIQQLQHQQLILHQQHQQPRQPQHLMLNSTQNEQRNIKVSQQLAVANVKWENSNGAGLTFHSDSLSSTPPELLQGVPYSAVHTISSDVVTGCTTGTLRLQNQVAVLQNIPLSQVPDLKYPSTNSNNYNTIHNNSTAPQTLCNYSNQQYIPITKFNNNSAAGPSSNCGPSEFPETFCIGPYSPATLETTEVIDTIAQDIGIPPQVDQQHNLVSMHEAQEKKFVPRDQKFLPSSTNAMGMMANGCEGGRDGIQPGLTRAKTIDVTTLNNWPGDNNFQIKVVPNDKHSNKWCYSSKVNRLYCYPMLAAEVQVSVNDWMQAGFENAEVRVVAVYQDAQNRTRPVHRCHNCKKSDKTSLDLMEHMVQISNSGAVHSVTGSRYTVSVPMVRSHLGEDSVTLLICCTCMSSCVGGPNRRPFALLFSLIINGEEKGRQLLSTKCCKGPKRDMKKDETDYDRQLGLIVENAISAAPTEPVVPEVVTSPKKPTLAIAGSSGLNIDLSSSPKSSAIKRKSAGKKLIIPGDMFSSDSETDRSSSKRSKLGNSNGGVRSTVVATREVVPEGYVTLLIPADLKNDVVKYIEGQLALRYLRNNRPHVLKSIELP